MEEDDFKAVLAFTASVSTILQFLTGIIICKNIVIKRSTGELSPFPFISGWLSTSMWLRYGFFIKDNSLIFVNLIGATLFFSYIIIFYLYTIKKNHVLKLASLCICIYVFCLAYTQYETNEEIAVKHMGLLCCVMTVLFFTSPLFSLIHVIKTKNCDSLPFPLILATTIVCFQWYIYGGLLGDLFIQIPNFLGCILSISQLSLFYVYKNKQVYTDQA